MQNLPSELTLILTKNLDISDLNEFCKVSKKNIEMCKENANVLAKHFIKKYEIDYEDPNNFIYIMTETSIEECKNKNDRYDYNYKKIINLYLKYFKEEEIYCAFKNISSIPIYPKLKKLDCFKNNIKSLPSFPELTELNCYGNKILNKLSTCPKLIYLRCEFNSLETLPSFPMLQSLDCHDNKLITLPEYPKLEILNCYNNKLESLSEYPMLKILKCYNNANLETIPEYPNLVKIDRDSTLHFDKKNYPKLQEDYFEEDEEIDDDETTESDEEIDDDETDEESD